MNFWTEVSVVLIVLDAEALLPAALESIPAEAEVIVADGGSRDRTVEVARQLGARITEQNLSAIAQAEGNFDIARNDAAQYASRNWVLFLDADERLTPELKSEIAALGRRDASGNMIAEACAAYDLPRKNLFWGKAVRLLGEDWQTRLVKKGKGQYAGKTLHQKMIVQGKVGSLHSPLIHLNLCCWGDVVRRFRRYLPSEARHYPPIPSLRKALFMPWHMFRYYYFQNDAWRDGWRGLLVCLIYSIYHGSAAWASWRNSNA